MREKAIMTPAAKRFAIRTACLFPLGGAILALGPVAGVPHLRSSAIGQPTESHLPPPPPGGTMAFVVTEFIPPVLQEKTACPAGTVLKIRDQYLHDLPEAERARLSLKENEKELVSKWQASVFGPNNTNICSQPDMFSRPEMRTVQSKYALGLHLDGGKDDTCEHEQFTTPDGQSGIDNQEYRVMGCTLEWRGTDGIKGDQAVGMRQFHASGEWTQVILLHGVDSLENDPDVEVIYANTPDRPTQDSMGNFLRGASFSISTKPPRERNVLHGRIVNGVLTTDSKDIKLTQTWGQGGARDLRGNRSKYDFRHGKLQLKFQSDGSVRGMVGGYKPVFDVIQSPSIGGVGSALVAGIDCSQYLQTLRKYADGIKDPKTGKCTGVSAAMQLTAIPAFVNDIPAATAIAQRSAK